MCKIPMILRAFFTNINLIYEESNSSSCSLEYVDTNELILQKETPEEVKKSKRLFRKK